MKQFAHSARNSARNVLWNPRAVLFVILVIASLLRFYSLDVPSMWGDELFASIMADKPLGYLMRWNFLEDVHPPLYYFFMKCILLFGRADFALRLPSVVFGIFSVYLMYVAAKAWIDEESGLYAACFMAFSFPHLYLSRVVRFYSATVLLVVLAIILLKKFVDTKDKKMLLYIACLLAALLMCEYTSIMVIVGFYAILLFVILRSERIIENLRLLTVYSVASFSLPCIFLAITSVQRKGYSLVSTVEGAMKNFFNALVQLCNGTLFASASGAWVVGLMAVLVAVGMIMMLRHSRALLGVLLVITIGSMGVILCIRPGYSLAFWHLFFLVPGLVLVASQGARALVPSAYRVPAALGICLTAAVIVAGPLSDRYYAEDALGPIKRMGKAVASEVQPGSAVLINTDETDFINWYADQFCLDNRLRNQRLDPAPGPVILNVLLDEDQTLGHLISPARPVEGWAKIAAVKPLGKAKLVQAVITRDPVVTLDLSGKELDLDAHPARFYGRVHSANNVMIDAYWGNVVIPTVNDAPCGFTYLFENPGKSGNLLLGLRLVHKNTGRDNLFKASYRFDDEPPVELASSRGPALGAGGGGDNRTVETTRAIRREAPFRRLRVDVEMTAQLVTPKYPTSNLNLVGFKQLVVTARPFGPDLMREEIMDPLYALDGLRGVEREGDRRWRWATGEASGVTFSVDADAPMRLTYGFTNPFPGQGYTLTANGKQIAEESGLARRNWNDPVEERSVEFTARKGVNTVSFAFAKINHVTGSISETDATPYTVAFRTLRLERAP